eukprot:739081-Hanusia_phi.AAC.1
MQRQLQEAEHQLYQSSAEDQRNFLMRALPGENFITCVPQSGEECSLPHFEGFSAAPPAHRQFLSLMRKLHKFCSRWLTTFLEIHLEKEYVRQVIKVLCETIKEETDYLEREIRFVSRHEEIRDPISPPRDKRFGNSVSHISTTSISRNDYHGSLSSSMLSSAMMLSRDSQSSTSRCQVNSSRLV